MKKKLIYCLFLLIFCFTFLPLNIICYAEDDFDEVIFTGVTTPATDSTGVYFDLYFSDNITYRTLFAVSYLGANSNSLLSIPSYKYTNTEISLLNKYVAPTIKQNILFNGNNISYLMTKNYGGVETEQSSETVGMYITIQMHMYTNYIRIYFANGYDNEISTSELNEGDFTFTVLKGMIMPYGCETKEDVSFTYNKDTKSFIKSGTQVSDTVKDNTLNNQAGYSAKELEALAEGKNYLTVTETSQKSVSSCGSKINDIFLLTALLLSCVLIIKGGKRQ